MGTIPERHARCGSLMRNCSMCIPKPKEIKKRARFKARLSVSMHSARMKMKNMHRRYSSLMVEK